MDLDEKCSVLSCYSTEWIFGILAIWICFWFYSASHARVPATPISTSASVFRYNEMALSLASRLPLAVRHSLSHRDRDRLRRVLHKQQIPLRDVQKLDHDLRVRWRSWQMARDIADYQSGHIVTVAPDIAPVSP